MSNNRPLKKNPHITHLYGFASRVLSDRSLKVTLKMPQNRINRGRDIYTGGQRPISQDVLVVFHRLQVPG